MLVGQSGARSTSSYSLFSVPLVSRIEGSRQHGCNNWVPIKCETKRNETKSTKTKRNETKSTKTKRNETKSTK